ncbi:hypothetical protein PIROE2DRAFT_1606 [Piromyces sp. E2]|nr:hypothetical protein PIROE2DRAFT_1606 [Piromyces sp. E2]|eukprot:OUM70203.1 hypothetical protein PIROE2DRAFT_1606 [Piromyces sp. E2]
MNHRKLYYLVYIALLCTTIHGLTKKEVLKLDYGQYYCKGDVCVSTRNRDDLDTIIFPNADGKNVTYITETCSTIDIDLNLCFSKNCTADSQCLSNKCTKGHCTFNKDNPITHCQFVRTVHDDPYFGDPKGYKMQCGLPEGDTCNSNEDCSSYNCVSDKQNKNKLCGEPDDSGCTSLCANSLFTTLIVSYSIIAIILGVIIYICCCCVKRRKKLKQKRNNEEDKEALSGI